VSFRVERGERVALVGSTGAGKSSIVNLLVRFWEQEEGTIRVEGRDLRSFAAEEARALFSVAAQGPYLFHTTIRENLLVASPHASDSEIRRALAAAQLAGFVEDLPKGLGTEVGESGLQMSAGEARRIAVARAILKEASILVLDEPTEDLDAPTGRAMMEAISHAAEGRTMLVITHHLTGLGTVDRVLVFERGRIVEQGSPAELVLTGRLYRQLLEIGG
jgi:ATP-binding cassette subfamily C protein CydC